MYFIFLSDGGAPKTLRDPGPHTPFSGRAEIEYLSDFEHLRPFGRCLPSKFKVIRNRT